MVSSSQPPANMLRAEATAAPTKKGVGESLVPALCRMLGLYFLRVGGRRTWAAVLDAPHLPRSAQGLTFPRL